MRSLGVAVAVLAACGSNPKPKPNLTADPRFLAAADTVLECMGSAGTTCLYTTEAATAWIAQTDLELIATEPPPLLADQLLRAADKIGSPADADRAVAAESELAAPLTRDLSCRAQSVRNVGAEYSARRKALVERAENLGLGGTEAGPAVAALAGAAEKLDGARLVTVRCTKGSLFVLLSPPVGQLDAEEDPRAHAGGGWRAFIVSYDEPRLLRGLRPPEGPAKQIVDPARRDVVDPWIPATEMDL